MIHMRKIRFCNMYLYCKLSADEMQERARIFIMKPYQNRIVVKVGTSTLTNELGKSDLRCFDRLA